MSNTSATGGCLTPTTGPLDDQALRRFLQAMIAGVTGLDGSLVRPLWQSNPPKQPDISTNWIAFGITEQRPDANPFHKSNGNGSGAIVIRHEELDVRCSCYGPDCTKYTGHLREALYLAQNRENLFSAGMGLVGFSDTVHAPELINERFFDRADITMTLRREIRREYPILNFVGAYGTIVANRATETLSINWSA